jgi:hypothetical protein
MWMKRSTTNRRKISCHVSVGTIVPFGGHQNSQRRLMPEHTYYHKTKVAGERCALMQSNDGDQIKYSWEIVGHASHKNLDVYS